MRKGWVGFVCASVLIWSGAGCATFGQKSKTPKEVAIDEPDSESSEEDIRMPRSPSAARDSRATPILQVVSAGKIVYPYVYGYPLYPEGDAARGIPMLRTDNWTGARFADSEDSAGVVHAVEELPQLGCRFDGIRETLAKFVPLSLTCELPAPKGLGGAKKPVLGSVGAGAKPEQILEDKMVKEVFLGEFHLKSDDFASGSGTAYFNTTHGQLALVFSKKKLAKFIYYFDPGVKGWQNPALWVKPL